MPIESGKIELGLDEVDTERWARVQEKTYIGWMNDKLSSRGRSVTNLTSDLRDGLALIELIEVLARKPFSRRYNKRCTNDIHERENLHWFFEELKKLGVRCVNIGNIDVLEGNSKLIMGLVWSLISRYQIAEPIDTLSDVAETPTAASSLAPSRSPSPFALSRTGSPMALAGAGASARGGGSVAAPAGAGGAVARGAGASADAGARDVGVGTAVRGAAEKDQKPSPANGAEKDVRERQNSKASQKQETRKSVAKRPSNRENQRKLLKWVSNRVEPFSRPQRGAKSIVDVRNFTNSWADGKALYALVYSLNMLSGDDISFWDARLGTPIEIVAKAMCMAESQHGVAPILSAEDFLVLDERSIMTYVSLLRDKYFEKTRAVLEKSVLKSASCVDDDRKCRKFILELRKRDGSLAPDSRNELLRIQAKCAVTPLDASAADEVANTSLEIAGDGLFLISVPCIAPGAYSLDVKLDGRSIPNCPRNFDVDRFELEEYTVEAPHTVCRGQETEIVISPKFELGDDDDKSSGCNENEKADITIDVHYLSQFAKQNLLRQSGEECTGLSDAGDAALAPKARRQVPKRGAKSLVASSTLPGPIRPSQMVRDRCSTTALRDARTGGVEAAMVPPAGEWDVDRGLPTAQGGGGDAASAAAATKLAADAPATPLVDANTEKTENKPELQVEHMNVISKGKGVYAAEFVFQESGVYILRIRASGRAICEPLEVQVLDAIFSVEGRPFGNGPPNVDQTMTVRSKAPDTGELVHIHAWGQQNQNQSREDAPRISSSEDLRRVASRATATSRDGDEDKDGDDGEKDNALDALEASADEEPKESRELKTSFSRYPTPILVVVTDLTSSAVVQPCPIYVTDESRDGRYLLRWHCTEPGYYRVAVSAEARPLGTYDVTIKGVPEAEHSLLEGLPRGSQSAQTNRRMNLKLTLRDEEDNCVGLGEDLKQISMVWHYPNVKNAILMQAQHSQSRGDGKLSSADTLDTAQNFPETETVDVSWLQDNLDGTYSCKLLPEVPGRHCIDVKFQDQHIKGSPFSVQVEPDDEYLNSELEAKRQMDLENDVRFLGRFIPIAQEGIECMKYPYHSRGKPLRRVIRIVEINTNDAALAWGSAGKGGGGRGSMKASELAKKSIPLVDVSSVIAGKRTLKLRRFATADPPELCLSIVSDKRTLDLVFPSAEKRDTWVRGLNLVIQLDHIKNRSKYNKK